MKTDLKKRSHSKVQHNVAMQGKMFFVPKADIMRAAADNDRIGITQGNQLLADTRTRAPRQRHHKQHRTKA